MIRTALRITFALSIVGIVAGCSSNVGDNVGTSSESLSVLVHLPKKLGGVDRVTGHAPHHTPQHVYPAGLPVKARRATSGGVLNAMSDPIAGVPRSVDLSQYAPAPGDQGQTGSCAAWSTGYSSMGWWAAK